jgi:DNA adenine methylase
MDKAFKTYFGGKEASGVYQTIINHIRPHKEFYEPFGGNFAISRKIKKGATKIVNDLCKETFEQYLILKEKKGFEDFEFYNLDYKSLLLNRKLTKEIVIYFDPPYPLDSRKSNRKVYKHEMTDLEHLEFLFFVGQHKSKCDILISTYPNDIYLENLKDWYRVEFYGCDRQGKTIEWLFLNYNPDEIKELHDFNYFGNDNIERQKIKRVLENNIRKFKNMNPILRSEYFKTICNLEM